MSLDELNEIQQRIMERSDRLELIFLDELEKIPDYRAYAQNKKLSIYAEKHPEIEI